MFKQSRSFSLLLLSLALIGASVTVSAQKTKKESAPSRAPIEKGSEKGIAHPEHGAVEKKESISEKKESISEAGKLKAVNIEIKSVTKDDAKAQKNPDGKSRLVPVRFEWLNGGSSNAKLVSLEALLETVNTDGSKTRVSKKLHELVPDKVIAEIISLPMPEGVFARDFKLTLKGKCRPNNLAELVELSEVKTGSFPLQANLLDRKK